MPTTQLVAGSDPSQDLLGLRSPGLDMFFHPRTVAVVGASEKFGTVGKAVFDNLLKNPSGLRIVPVNPSRPTVAGVQSYPSLSQVPGQVDLAVLILKASSVPAIIDECVAKGVTAAIIISAGFRETGPEGLRLEQEIMAKARGKMRIVGPNCLGLMNPVLGLNATFAGSMARGGNLAFLSQSGALCTAILDWSLKVNIGFSGFVSTGSMMDVGWGDLIDYFGHDPRTNAILLYMETIGDARAFLSAAREVALTKPIIVIKGGRTEEAAKAVSSHTGTLAGSDAVLDAAFERVGVQRVDTVAELFYLAESLSNQPRPKGSALTIVTNAGGPGVLTADALIGGGGKLSKLSDATSKSLDAILPPHWSHNNPIDVIGDADSERFSQAVKIALDDPASDGVLAILTIQAMTNPTETAAKLAGMAQTADKPLLASWMGGAGVEEGVKLLNEAKIPTFPFPDTAARIFNYMSEYQRHLSNLYETPQPYNEDAESHRRKDAAVSAMLDAPWDGGRTTLTEFESKLVLKAYGIPVVETSVARNEEEAVRQAESMGFPVVLKLNSKTLTHKTDVDGVKLNLKDAVAVRAAYQAIQGSVGAKAGKEHFQGVSVQRMIGEKGFELILGGSVNSQFGPVMLFGWGGTMVEILSDRSLALPPLNANLARLMMEKTKVYKALQGARGKAGVDMDALKETLIRFSQIMLDHPRIKEIDINPFLVSDKVQVALDARVILHSRDVAPVDLPRPAIRPYPTRYVGEFTLQNAAHAMIRPIRPEDEPSVARFHARLSERTVYDRYLQPVRLDQRVAHERLVRICFNDYDRSIALVAQMPAAVGQAGPNGTGAGSPTAAGSAATPSEIVAIARLTKSPGGGSADVSVVVEDNYQGLGLGGELTRRLLRVAADEGLAKVVAYIRSENQPMVGLCKSLGFTTRWDENNQWLVAEYTVPAGGKSER